jgi:hypothetical protein
VCEQLEDEFGVNGVGCYKRKGSKEKSEIELDFRFFGAKPGVGEERREILIWLKERRRCFLLLSFLPGRPH